MINEKGNRIEFYKKQALVYSRKKIPVHISKNDGIFYNGMITELGSNFFFIEDFEEGRKLVFFQELKHDIIEYRKERKNAKTK